MVHHLPDTQSQFRTIAVIIGMQGFYHEQQTAIRADATTVTYERFIIRAGDHLLEEQRIVGADATAPHIHIQREVNLDGQPHGATWKQTTVAGKGPVTQHEFYHNGAYVTGQPSDPAFHAAFSKTIKKAKAKAGLSQGAPA